VVIYKRRGGKDSREISHREWLNTVQGEPDVISMSFLPITSLLNGVPGSGFLNHAINLYLRCNHLFFFKKNISVWFCFISSYFCS
jgi:MAC/Perforin domain